MLSIALQYFISWGFYPILSVLGPEGFGAISAYASLIAHLILDITAKTMVSEQVMMLCPCCCQYYAAHMPAKRLLRPGPAAVKCIIPLTTYTACSARFWFLAQWPLAAHLLRVKIHEHIIIHGNLTKKTKIMVAGG
jgi:hypothetical protein